MTKKIKLYSYKSCGTCKKAMKWLEDNSIEYEIIDIISNPPDKSLIKKAIDQLESRKLIFNTSGKSYRNIGAEKVKLMSDEKAIESLTNDSMLLKRPILINSDQRILVGFNLLKWEDLLINSI